MTSRPNGRTTAQLRSAVLDAYGARCHLCGGDIPLDVARSSPLRLELDHLITHEQGGEATVANLRPAHAKCNRRRGAGPAAPPPPSAAAFFKSAANPGKTSSPVLPPAPEKNPPQPGVKVIEETYSAPGVKVIAETYSAPTGDAGDLADDDPASWIS